MKTSLSQEPAKYLSTLLSAVQFAVLASKAQVLEASNERSILGWGR